MRRLQRAIAIPCILLIASPLLPADDIRIEKPKGGFMGFLTHQFQAPAVTPVNWRDSSRLASLVRAGKIYLSLQDAIALALENNLDIESERYVPFIAQADLKRSLSGSLSRGISTSVTQGPASASTASPAAIITTGVVTQVGSGLSQLGPNVPTLDPVVSGGLTWAHVTSPQINPFAYGTNILTTTSTIFSAMYSQNFLHGTTVQLSFTNNFVYQNTYLNFLNPSRSASAQLFVAQPLLQGFSLAVNNRYIRIAKNNTKIADSVFEQQVIATVSNVISLYWDLVSFTENVRYAQQNLTLAEENYNDNKKQVEIGTMAPIEITTAEAELAARQQDVTVAETSVLQQETILKSVLTHRGLMDPVIAEARIVPTDSIHIPERDNIPPLGDLMADAMTFRPELRQSALNVDNSKIQLQGTHNELLPSLSIVGMLMNRGLAGLLNSIEPPPGSGFANEADPFFIGGNPLAWEQVLRRNFPIYRLFFSLNIPFRNRAAQSDYVHDQLTLRQSELAYQKQEKQVRQDVINAVNSLEQARAQYEAAARQAVLQRETLAAEQKKFRLGASTTYLVIQAQRDLALAESNQVVAESVYQKAKVNLDVATGRILPAHGINIEEARKGVVSRGPSALPPAR